MPILGNDKAGNLSHFVSISYTDEQGSKSLDQSLIALANNCYGGTSERAVNGSTRMLEFLFPHFEQVSWFTSQVAADFPQVAIDRVA